MISGIEPRNDKLNHYAVKVNKILREAGSKRNNGFIDNKNVNPRYNCNWDKLHLNKRVTNLLTDNTLFGLHDGIRDWPKGTVSKNSSCK